ncbi:hypothetical protein LR68_01756 [Anoxybacillus sp. BCO1]|nr:hypothetical protein LR68_01756 [Anoxybacillus sp. BCO1]
MFATVADSSTRPAIHLFQALNKGLEKVISTIGIHELRGYSRLFSSIGLHEEVAAVLNIVNFFGSDSLAQNFEALKQDAIARANDFETEQAKLRKTFHVFPRIWKAIGEVAQTAHTINIAKN